MKKMFTILLIFAGLLSIPVSALEASDVKYLKADEGYQYGADFIYVAADSATGEIIPLSIGPLDEYTYAYLPGNSNIALKKIQPTAFNDIDLKNDSAVNELSARGVITGYEDGSFRPFNALSRAEMAVVFARMFRIAPDSAESCFSDVATNSWCSGYIMALVNKGVLKKDVLFHPNDPVTHEQLTAMAYRMLSDMNCISSDKEFDFAAYPDFEQVSEYAKNAYRQLLANGYTVLNDWLDYDPMDLADDRHMLRPQKSVLRYGCAAFLYDNIRSFFRNNAPAIKRDTAPDAEIPILDGSTSTYDITQNIYWQYYKNHTNHPDFPKAHSKTSNSYRRLIDGEVEMIFVPDPSEEITRYAEEKGVTLKYIPIANEALVFFTSDKNETDSVTTEQLYNIYVNNNIKNWQELGGNNTELVAYCRNNDSGSHAQMEKFILNGKEINDSISKERTSWVMSSILTDVDDFNRENPGKYAIGYTLYYYYVANQNVLGPFDLKLMKINGVEPTEENIANGAYPYTTNYYAVIRDEENPKVAKFVELMQSDFGKDIIRNSGLGVIE